MQSMNAYIQMPFKTSIAYETVKDQFDKKILNFNSFEFVNSLYFMSYFFLHDSLPLVR